jgi:outer membrane receptor for ferrienterochelin and colicins
MSLFHVRRWMTSTALMLGLLPFAAGQVSAQGGTISGKVTDQSSGAPLENAQVQVSGGGASLGAVTAADGSYRVLNVGSGVYTVTVRRIGFESQTVEGKRANDVVNFALRARAAQLTETVVTASRSRPEKALDAPAQISVISSERIAERPAATITDQLRGVPGVDVNRGGIAQANIVARGFNNAFSGSILMLQDYRFAGVPSLRVNVPFLMTGTNEDIDRIEVLLGPASALYGPNSANGVLHVITKSPFSQEPGRRATTTISVDGGERSLVRVGARTAVKLSDRAAFKISGESFQARDWEFRDLAEPATFPAAAPTSRRGAANQRDFDLQRYTGEARLDLRPREGMELITTYGMTKVGSGLELTGANGTAQIKNWTYNNIQQRFRWGRFFAQAFMNSSNAGNDDSLDVSGTYLLRSGQPIVDKSQVWAVQAQHGFDIFNQKQSFTYGVDYIATNPETGGTINGRNERNDNTREVGGYLQSSTKPFEKFEVLTAMRVDGNNVIEGSFFSPRAALIFKPVKDKHTIRATYNRAFQTPGNFTFFLDLVQSRAAGANPYDVFVQGNPPKQGFQFRRDCPAGASYESLCMRSPFTANNGFQPVSAGAAVPGVWTALTPVVQPQLTAGVTQALSAPASAGGLGLPAATAQALAAQLAPAMLARLAGRVPTEAELPTGLFIGNSLIANANGLADIDPLRAAFNNTYELGYKGQLFDGRWQVDISAWGQERGDVGTSAGQATPVVLARSPQAYSAYVVSQWTTVIQGAAAQNNLPISEAQARGLATALAGGVVPTAAALPLGVVTWDEAAGGQRRILATYFNAGDKKIWIRGLDIATTIQATQNFAISGNYSYQDRTIFRDILGGNAAPLMSNSPSSRGSIAGRYENAANTWSYETRLNYAESHPVNSGVYGTTASWPIAPGNPGATTTAAASAVAGCPTNTAGRFCYENVPEALTVDMGISRKFDVGAQKLRWSLNATNLFNNQVRTFPGVPIIGRMLMTRIQYTF